MPTKEELLANDKSISSMCNHIQAASLRFLSLDELYKALTEKAGIPITRNLVIIILLVSYRIKPRRQLTGFLKLNNYLYLVVSQIINQLLKFYFSYPSTTLNY